MGNRKALFFDVDGTLLNEAHEIPESTETALKQARKNGHLVFINSGRVSGLLKQLTERIDVDGILCGCGTEVIVEGKQIYYYNLSEKWKEKIKTEILPLDIDYIMEGKNGCYFRPETSRFPEVERTRRFVAEENGHGSESFEGLYEISKFCIQSDEKSDLERFKKIFSEAFDIIDRGNGFFECVPHGHDKGTAILKVLEYYQIPVEDAYVFGDSSNDVGMFQVCKNCIAMKKHDQALEAYASFVTKDINDDGIAYALKHFEII